jgi:CelD/BcsL family acetyltransferase involved in cellulose biosynthesis
MASVAPTSAASTPLADTAVTRLDARGPAASTTSLVEERYAPDLWTRIGDTWSKLYASSASASPFMHPLWVQTWIEIYGAALEPDALIVRDGPAIVGICLRTRQTRRKGPIRLKQVYLNTAGEPAGESVCAEHQRLLHAPHREEAVAATLASALLDERWDELVLEGFEPQAYKGLAARLGLTTDERWSPDPYVDLDALRGRRVSYLDSRSRNTREQIRRSVRRYAAIGPVTVTPATTSADASTMLAELIDLHERTWRARGERGAFGTAAARAFHERLVARGTDQGFVTMLRATAGTETIGVLYIITERRRACFYQSGFRYTGDNRDKPGLVCHTLAIEYFEARQFAEYDFLAGEHLPVRYKQSLATDVRSLGWIAVQRPTLAVAAVAALRRLKHRLQALRTAEAPETRSDPV